MSKKQFNISRMYLEMGQSDQPAQSTAPATPDTGKTVRFIAALVRFGYTAKQPAITRDELENGRSDE